MENNYPLILNPLEIELDEIIQSHLLDLKLIKKIKNTILFHYTNLDGFKNIVENQSFYFSNSAYLNDKQEFKQGISSFKKALSDYSNSNVDSILSKINSKIDDLVNNSKSERYVVCFSTEADLLSQWRAYANNGSGICIGFDLNNLKKEFKGVESFSIIYNENIQNKITIEVIKKSVDFYESKKQILLKYMNLNIYEELISNEIFNQITKFIGQLKHSAFSEEKEFRFEIRIDNDIESNREIKHKVGKNNLFVPFINEKVNKLPIKKIILGPSLNEKLNKTSISDFLIRNKYSENEIEVFPSYVPYRN